MVTATATAMTTAATVVMTVATIVMATTTMAMARIAARAAAATTEQAGRSRAFTAHQGDTDDREENRDTKHYDAVHSRILQLLSGTVSKTTQDAVNLAHLALVTAGRARCVTFCSLRELVLPLSRALLKLLLITKNVSIAQARRIS